MACLTIEVTEKQPKRQPKIQMADLSVDALSIFATQSKTGQCDEMMQEIMHQINELLGKKVLMERDAYGNLYVTKGKSETFPIFVCHTDTVHLIHPNMTIVRSGEGNYFAYTETGTDFQQIGIGGDDKCGIILCIELLVRLKNVKCAFFLDEEQGCKGSAAGDLKFFENGRYAIQIDRKHGGDIIVEGSGTELCSSEFKSVLTEIGKNYQYSPCTGANTDVVKLKTRGMAISSCNLSAGYYHPHSKQEHVNERDLLNCLEFCLAISTIKTVFPHEHKTKVYTTPASTVYTGAQRSLPATQYTKPPVRKGGYKDYTDWDEILSEINNIRHVGAPICKECDVLLTGDESYICTYCVENTAQQDHPNQLIVRTVQGQKLLVDRIQEAVGDTINAENGQCNLCTIDLISETEMRTGICISCSQCSGCGNSLKLEQEFIATMCSKCEDERKVETPICSRDECENKLVTPTEVSEAQCSDCKGTFSLLA